MAKILQSVALNPKDRALDIFLMANSCVDNDPQGWSSSDFLLLEEYFIFSTVTMLVGCVGGWVGGWGGCVGGLVGG